MNPGEPGPTPARVVVIGGGVGGLVCAWELARAGLGPMLLETEDEVGGAVRAHVLAGLTLDAGADSFAVARPAVLALLADLGLADRVVRPEPRSAWVRHARGTAPLPAGGLLGIPARPWAPDVRAVLGAVGTLRAAADRLLPARVGLGDAATLGSAVRTRLGRRAVDRLVEPVAGGVYASDPNTLELDAVAPGLRVAALEAGSLTAGAARLRGSAARPGAAVAGLDGGMHALPRALRHAIRAAGGSVRTGVAVEAVLPTPGGWLLRWPGGEQTAREVVLALPAAAASALLRTAGIDVPDGVAESTAPTQLASLVLQDHRLDGAPRGTGVLVSAQARGVTAKAMTHATAKWAWLAAVAGPGRHVLRLSYGRAGEPAPAPEALPAVALTDAAALLGIPLRGRDVVGTAVVGWPASLPGSPVGHRSAVARLRVRLAATPGTRLWVTGSWVAGTGLAAVVDDARATARSLLGTGPVPEATPGTRDAAHLEPVPGLPTEA